MSRTFSPWEVDKQWLIHPSVHDQVPPGHFAHFMCDLVREVMDLEDIYEAYDDDISRSPSYPAMMTALLLYAWCEGVYSSRKIAKACEQRVDFMALTAMEQPDFEAVRAFRDSHAESLVLAVVRFFRAAQRLGLPWGPIAGEDDGEKTSMSFGRADDPFEDEARRWVDRSRLMDDEEDTRCGPRLRGDEVPKWMPDKAKRIRKLKDVRLALEEEDRKREVAALALADDDDDYDDDDATGFVRAMPDDEDDDEDELPPPPPPLEEENPLLRRRSARSRRAAAGVAPPPIPPVPAPVPAPDPVRPAAPVRERVAPGTRRPLARAADRGSAAPSPEPAPPRRDASRAHHRPEAARPEPPPPAREPASSRAHHRPPAPRDGRARLATSEMRSRAPAAAARGRSSEPDAPLSDGFMVSRPEAERLCLIETVIATAMSDGHVAAIEERRIDQLVRILRLDSRSRQQVYATLRAGVMPPLPTAEELPDYDIRVHVFEQAAVMALADGVVHPDEQRHLRELAMVLELDIEDAKHALRRANFAAGG